MAEAMEVDSVLIEPTNTAHTESTESSASALQDKTSDEPQVTLEKPIECKQLVEEENIPNQQPIDQTDNTNKPKSEASVQRDTTIDKCPVTHENRIESEPLVEEKAPPNQQPFVETNNTNKAKSDASLLPEATRDKCESLVEAKVPIDKTDNANNLKLDTTALPEATMDKCESLVEEKAPPNQEPIEKPVNANYTKVDAPELKDTTLGKSEVPNKNSIESESLVEGKTSSQKPIEETDNASNLKLDAPMLNDTTLDKCQIPHDNPMECESLVEEKTPTNQEPIDETDNTNNLKSDSSMLQETKMDECQIPHEKPCERNEKPDECEPLVEDKNPPNQEPIEESNNTNNLKSDASVLQDTTMDECPIPRKKLRANEPVVEDIPIHEASNEVSIMDKQDTNMEVDSVNKESNINTIEKPKAQDKEITDAATECKESNEDTNIANDSKDIPVEESTTASDQQKLDISLNSDCVLIADTVHTVDLTMDDSLKQTSLNPDLTDKTVKELKVDDSSTEQVETMKNKSVNSQVQGDITVKDLISQATSLEQPNAENKQTNDKTVTDELNVDGSSSKQVESSKKKSANPQVEDENNSIDLVSQSNSVEPEKINEREVKENESSKDPQADTAQNVTKKITQNNEDVPVRINESPSKQVMPSSEPKGDQNHKAAGKTDLKETVTLNLKRKQCLTCSKYHADKECTQLKGTEVGAEKKDDNPLSEPPAAKKEKAEAKYPEDLVSMIAKHIETPPDISAWTKLKQIKECQILYLNHLPKSWSHNEMKEFMKKHVKCISETFEICFFTFVRDAKFNPTGECLIKFKNSDYCHKAWFDLRGVKVEDTPVSIDMDLGHNIMKQVRKESKMRAKNMNGPAEEPPKNIYETIKQKHEEILQQKGQADENPPSNSSSNESPAGNTKQTDGAGTTNASQSNDKNSSVGPKVKPSYMPPEKFDNTTYGLNEGFLQSLGLRLPLCNVIIVLGLDHEVDDDKLKEVFSLAGTVKRAFRVLKSDGGPTMKGIVEFDHPVEAVQAVSMFHCKQLHGRNLNIKMAPKAMARPLPTGLTEVGPGLGFEGEPMKGVRPLIELQSLKKMLMDFRNQYNTKMAEIDKSIASLNKSIAMLTAKSFVREPPKKFNTSQAQPPASEAATQLATALNSLAQPNILMGLTNLINAQGLVQQGMGVDQAAMAVQNQMMMQNAAYAQNVNMQGIPQQTLPGAFPQPGLVQPQLMQPMDQTQMFYGQQQMMQPGYMAVPTVPSATVVAAPQINPKPQTSFPNQTQPAATQQQTPAYTPRPPEPKASSKTQATSSNWNATPVTAAASQKQKAVQPKASYSAEPKITYSSEPKVKYSAEPKVKYSAEPKVKYSDGSSKYKRQSRFDMKEKPNLKVIDPEPEPEPESEKKNDLLVFSNLPSSVSVQALNGKMREVGDVVFGEITGRGRALVRFKHARDAERCIKLFNRSKVDGQVITVEYF